MTLSKRILWPLGAGLAGCSLLALLYFGLVSWAESPQHALDLFWQDRWIVLPIILGFGVQAALYTILKKRLFVPVAHTGSSGGGYMKRNILLIAGLFIAGFLAACGSEPTGQLSLVAAAEEPASESTAPVWETAVDEQGAVTVAVTPVDLDQQGSELAFEVAMNTHSVDLSMDLAELATLTTDIGRSVPATLWDAVPGGHHVSGVLVFPAVVAGTAVLEGAAELTLTITGVDVPSRTFIWSFNQ